MLDCRNERDDMGLTGKLEDLGFGEILQIIRLSGKSGHLCLSQPQRQVELSFEAGRVVQVVDSNLAGRFQDQEAPGAAAASEPLTAAADESAARSLVVEILRELATWQEGHFIFELWDAAPPESLPPGRGCIRLRHGICPQSLTTTEPAPEPRTATVPENVIACRHDPGPALASVWLVDDDAIVRQSLGAELTAQGFSVTLFSSAAEFWTALLASESKGLTPLPIIDLIMPRLNGEGVLGGLELLELVQERFPEISPLAICDYRNAELTRRVRTLGLPEIFAKPRTRELRDASGRKELAALGKTLSKELARLLPRQRPAGESHWPAMDSFPAPSSGLAASPGEHSPGLLLLKGMLQELGNPSLGGGVLLLVLRFASEFMNRAVIFKVRDDHLIAVGQFGLETGSVSGDDGLLGIRVPRDSDGLLARVSQQSRPCKAEMGSGQWDRNLCQALGGAVPREVFLGPIVSEGRVVAVLYGDNLPRQALVGDTEALEIFLSQAGLAMEKALLEGRLKSAGSA